VIRFTLVGQSASEVRRIIQAEGHENDSEPTFPLAKTGAISTFKRWHRWGMGSVETERRVKTTESMADRTAPAVVQPRLVRLCSSVEHIQWMMCDSRSSREKSGR